MAPKIKNPTIIKLPTIFYSSVFLFLFTYCHNNQAKSTLPATAASVIIKASNPMVGNPLITDSLLPASTPSRNRSNQIKTVITFCIQVTLTLRNKYPRNIPESIIPITTNIFLHFLCKDSYSQEIRGR